MPATGKTAPAAGRRGGGVRQAAGGAAAGAEAAKAASLGRGAGASGGDGVQAPRAGSGLACPRWERRRQGQVAARDSSGTAARTRPAAEDFVRAGGGRKVGFRLREKFGGLTYK